MSQQRIEDALARAGYNDRLHRLYRVCRPCGSIFWEDESAPERQVCRCRGRADQPRWEAFDINEHHTLCHCCGLTLLRSGSKFSVWFCGECKRRVMELNEDYGVAVIPVGRHSLMAGVGLRSTEAPAGGDRFLRRLGGLFDRMDILSEWSRSWVADIASAASDVAEPVELELYLRTGLMDTRFDKTAAFDSLIGHLRSRRSRKRP